MEVSEHSLTPEDVEMRRDAGQVRAAAGDPRKKTRAPVEPDAAWTLEPHVCGACFGRLVSRALADGDVRYLCTNCGGDAVGLNSGVLCACGTTLRRPGAAAPVDARIRCQLNPEPTPDFPSLFVAGEVRV